MRLTCFAFLLFSLQPIAFGQLDDNTVTVTSTRTIPLQPDQASLSVYAYFEPSASLGDVLTAVQSAGITATNFSGVFTSNGVTNVATTEWSFSVTVPFSGLTAKLSALSALQQAIQRNSTRSILYNVNGSRVSPELAATAVCSYAALLRDASAQAQTISSSAGLMLGPIVALSDGTTVNPSPVLAGDFSVHVFAARIFDPAGLGGFSALGLFSGIPSPSASGQPTCTLTVQYRLLH